MRINSINLVNFRNYANQTLEFSDRTNLVYGDNAQGKTNILEAIHLFSIGRSFRTRRLIELIKFGENFSVLNLEFCSHQTDCVAKFMLENNQRSIKINGIKAEKIGKTIGYFNSVLFAPEHLSIIKDGPKKRRQAIDMLICQLKPSYLAALFEHKKIILNKNHLLKKASNDPKLKDMIFAWNVQLCKAAAKIVVTRRQYIKRLSIWANEIHRKISCDREDLEIRYISCINQLDDDETLQTVENLLFNLIEKNSEREFALRASVIGTHREDLGISINKFSARMFASQGQQKTAILALKLAEVKLIEEETNEPPVVLLDDIMSEFDLTRRKFIAQNISKFQTIITCTDDILTQAKKFNITNGTVKIIDNNYVDADN